MCYIDLHFIYRHLLTYLLAKLVPIGFSSGILGITSSYMLMIYTARRSDYGHMSVRHDILRCCDLYSVCGLTYGSCLSSDAYQWKYFYKKPKNSTFLYCILAYLVLCNFVNIVLFCLCRWRIKVIIIIQGSYRSSIVEFPDFSSHGMTISLTLSKQ